MVAFPKEVVSVVDSRLGRIWIRLDNHEVAAKSEI